MAAAIDWLFVSGHVADLVVAVMLVEAVWLVRRCEWPVAATTFRLLPGALMMIALRAAITGADWRWIALALALSLPAHLADLAEGPERRRP